MINKVRNYFDMKLCYLKMQWAQYQYSKGEPFDFSLTDYPPEFPTWHNWIGTRHHLEWKRNQAHRAWIDAKKQFAGSS